MSSPGSYWPTSAANPLRHYRRVSTRRDSHPPGKSSGVLLASCRISASPPVWEVRRRSPGPARGTKEGTMSQSTMTSVEEDSTLNTVTWWEMPVADLAQAQRFYGTVFGWTFVPFGEGY